MFGTLLGPLPRPPLPDDAAPEALLDAALALQIEHGLEPLTDGGWSLVPDDPVAAWRATAQRTDRLAKAVVHGPGMSGRPAREVRDTLVALAEAGCVLIEIAEPAAAKLDPDDQAALTRFAETHAALTDGLAGVHLSMAITGGSVARVAIPAVLSAAYASLAVDLIDGPDNWYLVAAAPRERGIVAGALSTRDDSDDRVEVLLWAAAYAASTAGRGPDRVGLATAGSLAGLSWSAAERKVRLLGEAVRLAALPPEELKRRIDPRAVDIRSAGLGRYDPPAAPASGPARRVSAKSRKSSSPGE